jgi:hypothetical protein
MDEETEIKRQKRLEAWGRDDFSVYKPSKMLGEEGTEVTQELTIEKEVIDGTIPFVREKPRDVALCEGAPLELSCLVDSDPMAAVSWYKNDLIFMDDARDQRKTTVAAGNQDLFHSPHCLSLKTLSSISSGRDFFTV